jgi:hypothetical protein
VDERKQSKCRGINIEFNTGQDEMDKNRLGNQLPA